MSPLSSSRHSSTTLRRQSRSIIHPYLKLKAFYLRPKLPIPFLILQLGIFPSKIKTLINLNSAMTETSPPSVSPETLTGISLRSLTLLDIDDFMEWATDDRVSRFCRWDTYTSKQEGIDYINTTVLPHPWFRAICVDKRAVGAISVEPLTGNDRCRGELGYVLASKYWGRGIATRAVKLVLAEIFKDFKELERVEALVDVENVGSQRVLEKAGFQREGVLRKFCVFKGRTRDMIMFSFLNTDRKL